LRNIKVKGFKSIREMDLDLNPLNVLIGANGSGKSNLLDVFKMLGYIHKQNLGSFIRKGGGANRILHKGGRQTNQIEIALKFDPSHYLCELQWVDKDSLYFQNETISIKTVIDIEIQKYAKEMKTTEIIKPDKDGGIQEFEWEGGLESIIPQFAEIEDYYKKYDFVFTRDFLNLFSPFSKFMVKTFNKSLVYHFIDTSSSSRIKQTCNTHDNKFLRTDGSNLVAFLYLLKRKHSKNYQRIIETIQLVAPFFADFDLSPTHENEAFILLEWHHKYDDSYYNANQLSDGTLRFICLATLLLQPNPPPLILIDEPELGLHPHAISILAGLLRKAATQTQVIVATQSVTLVNQFKTEDIIVVDRKNEESIFSRPDEEEVVRWLEDFEEYGMGDLWEKNIIGGRP